MRLSFCAFELLEENLPIALYQGRYSSIDSKILYKIGRFIFHRIFENHSFVEPECTEVLLSSKQWQLKSRDSLQLETFAEKSKTEDYRLDIILPTIGKSKQRFFK